MGEYYVFLESIVNKIGDNSGALDYNSLVPNARGGTIAANRWEARSSVR
jgi:hypothetical protein